MIPRCNEPGRSLLHCRLCWRGMPRRWQPARFPGHNQVMSTPPPQKRSDSTKIEVNRPLVGVIALVCLLTAIVLWQIPDSNDMWVAGFMRAGLMTGAVWLALPTKNRKAAWANVSPVALFGGIGAIILAAARPKVLLALVPLLIALAIIGKFLRRRPGERPERDSWK